MSPSKLYQLLKLLLFKGFRNNKTKIQISRCACVFVGDIAHTPTVLPMQCVAMCARARACVRV